MEDDDYDDIADEDLIDVWDQVRAPQCELSRAQLPISLAKTAPLPQSRGVVVSHKSPKDLFTASSTRQAIDLDDLEDFFSDEPDPAPVRQNPSVNRLDLGPSSRLQPATFGRSQSFRQTTLLGKTVRDDDQRPPPSTNRVYLQNQPAEAPTHHALNHEALKTWVYPMNLGAIRDYQFNIVSRGLFKNTLVALPTGLGKTFIAATVMLNFFRWTKTAKIIFVAPTKPLVSQQVEACLNITGIPRSEATLLTGETSPLLREGEWASKRVFFMTPQTLMNDLSKGYADPKSIALIVIDEAHKATGDYAYAKVVEFVRRFQQSFRVLALTATPGSSVEAVQAVIDNLGISHVEIRTEDSIDISKYVHSKNEEIVQLEPSEEILRIQELFGKALKPFVDKLSAQNIYWGRDPMSLTTFGLMNARQEWMRGPGAHVNQGLKFSMMAVFNMLQSLAHSIKLLEFHGIKPFYDNLAEFRSESEAKGDKGSKLKRQLTSDKNFQEMMGMVEKWLKRDGFVSHPKVTCLSTRLLNHFMDAGQGSSTRAIVFCEYRDSAEALVKVLNEQKPLISAAVFVGQSDSKRSDGMKQKQQIETIKQFKSGDFNVLVATSIGEEGLDIGQVDLIICYDASASPIRMLQRMGRTGRKRAGKVVLLLMKGREEAKFEKSKDNYDKIQKMICDGSRFTFRHDLSTRIVPRGVVPEVDKRDIEIPFENSQDTSLPEPKKIKAGLKKKPAKKKFNMPDGVVTGFTKASEIGKAFSSAKVSKPVVIEELEEIPRLESVLLTNNQFEELGRVYKFVPYQGVDSQPLDDLDMHRFPEAQRRLQQTMHLKHSARTKGFVRVLKRMAKAKNSPNEFVAPDGLYEEDHWKKLPLPLFASDTEVEITKIGATKRGAKRKAPAPFADTSGDGLGEYDGVSEMEEEAPPAAKKRAPRGGRKAAATTKGKKAAKGKSRLKHRGDDLEDMGDNCERTSDISDDGSDDGADLDGWLVGDDELFSSFPSVGSTTPTSLSPPTKLSSSRSKATAPCSAEQKQGSTVYEPMGFAMTQDSLPDLDELLSSTKVKKTQPRPAQYDLSDDDFDTMEVEAAVQKAVTSTKRKPSTVEMAEEEDEEGEDVVDSNRKSALNKRRRVIADSEDDDDDFESKLL